MPNGVVHQVAGTLTGGGVAYYFARELPPKQQAAEVIGGLLGGWCTSRLPDIFDPPTHPGHRSDGHSLVIGGGSLVVLTATLAGFHRYIRAKADEFDRKSIIATDEISKNQESMKAILLHFLLGFSTGAIAGYASHLALDMFTPMSIPV